MKASNEYVNYEDFNSIETQIDELTTEFQAFDDSISDFEVKTWLETDFPYIQEVYRIETGLVNLSRLFVLTCYIYKEWLSSATVSGTKSFSNIDWNRWIEAIECLNCYMNSIDIRNCGQGYCGDTIWL